MTAILFYAQERALGRDDYVFFSRKGGHSTKQRADQVIKQAAWRATFQRTVHAHFFRHGYAINSWTVAGVWTLFKSNWDTRTSPPLESTYASPTRT